MQVHVERRWAAGGGVRAVAHLHVEAAWLWGRGSGLGLDGLGSNVLGNSLGQLEGHHRLGDGRLGGAGLTAVESQGGIATWFTAIVDGVDGATELGKVGLLLGCRHAAPALALRVGLGFERRHSGVVGGVDRVDAAAGLGFADAESLLVLLETLRQRLLGVVFGEH